MNKIFFKLLLAVCISQSVYAGDAARLDVLGFSANGEHLVFEQFGTQDGSGADYSELFLVNVVKNRFLHKPYVLIAEETIKQGSNVRKDNYRIALPRLKKFNLEHDSRHQGDLVIYHPLNDLGAEPDRVRFSPQTPLAGSSHDVYEIRLQTRSVKAKSCYGLGTAKIFTLALYQDAPPAPSLSHEDLFLAQIKSYQDKKINDNVALKAEDISDKVIEKQDIEKPEMLEIKVLQADKKLPKSRDCPMDYRIESVYLYQQRYLAVFLNMFLPRFEGQDMRYLVVTGELPIKEDTE
jgi:predicted secreted protein